jgi:hypothetical protein
LTIPIDIKHSHHLINLFVSDIFSKCIKHKSNLCYTDVAVAIHVKGKECFLDLIISERLILEHSLNNSISLFSVHCHASGIDYADTLLGFLGPSTSFIAFLVKLSMKGSVNLRKLSQRVQLP